MRDSKPLFLYPGSPLRAALCAGAGVSMSALLMIIALTLAGCAGARKGADQRGGAAPAIDQKLAAQENLRRLAASESSASSDPANPPVPAPPGVEEDALARRDPSDPKPQMPLDPALTSLRQNAAASELPPEPSAVDSEARTKALQLYAKGRNAALENRHLQAIIDFQKALELDPASPEILRELARSYAAENRTSQAVDVYEKLILMDPDNSEALFSVGLAAANRRDFPRAAELLGRRRLKGKSFEHDPAADVLADFTLAICLRELGYDRASIESATAAMDIPPQLSASAEHSARLGSVYRQRGETWRLIGDAHCRLGEHQKALEAYATAASLPLADPSALHPRVIYVYLCLGRTYTAQHELFNILKDQESTITDRDIRLCAYMRQCAGPVEILTQAVVDLYRQQPDRSGYVRAAALLSPSAQASELLREFVNRRPRDLDGVSQMLAWLAQQNQQEAARLIVALAADHPDLADQYADRLAIALWQPAEALAAVRTTGPSSARARIEAKLLAKYGGLGEAWSVCRAARDRWPDDRGLMIQELQLAAAMREPGLFEEALARCPPMHDAPWLLAQSQARRALGQTQPAVELAQQAAVNAPENVEALVELARAWGAQAAVLKAEPVNHEQSVSAIEQAKAAAEAAIALSPDRDEPYEVLALIYAPTGVQADTRLLRETAQRLRQANSQSRLLARMAAQEALNQKRYEHAIERLLNLYESDPSDEASLRLAVTAWQQGEKLDAAEQWLNDRLGQRPGDPSLTEQWVRVQIMHNRTDAAIERLQQTIQTSPDDLFARRLLESVYRVTGQIDSALELGQQRLLARPEGIRREVELAALYAGAELADKAFERLEWIHAHAQQADLDDLTSAVGVIARLPAGDPRRNDMTLGLVQHTIERFPKAPLQVYGSGLRAMASMNRLDETFDALADRAAANASGASDATVQGAEAWREMAQALVESDQPAAAARAVRARLRSRAQLDQKAFAMLARVALIADAAAEAADVKAQNPEAGAGPAQSGGSEHVESTIGLLRTLEEKNLLRVVLGGQERMNLAEGCFQASLYYSYLGSDQGAQRLLREAIALEPTDAMAINNLGYMRLEAGCRDEQTIQWIERAYTLLPDEPNISDTAGWLRYKQGRFGDEPALEAGGQALSGALSLIQKAIDADPQPSPEVFDHLGDVHWRLGDAQAAVEAWRQVVKLMDEPGFQQNLVQQFQLIQTQFWRLLVADPRQMYDREYGGLLERARSKLAAVERGEKPQVAPTFAELEK